MNTPLQDLAERCGQLCSIELCALAEQIDQAQAMLAQSLGQLRECFGELARAQPEIYAQHFQHATVALQAEDRVDQVLEHTRSRMARLAKLAHLQQLLITDLAQSLSRHCHDATTLGAFEHRFDHYAQELLDLTRLRRPVEDGLDTSGPVQLF